MVFKKDENRRRAYEGIRDVMRHWGFGDACSSIYAFLSISGGDISATEISREIGYAYSSVINELNHLMMFGLVKREKRGRKYIYSSVTDMLEIIRNERKRLIGLLEEVKSAIEGMKDREVSNLVESIDSALDYLKEVERRYINGKEYYE